MKHAKTQETLYLEAMRLLKENGSASTSFFQRKLCIGYAAAREIFDRMLDEGVAVRKKEFTIVLNKKGEKKMSIEVTMRHSDVRIESLKNYAETRMAQLRE